MKLDALLARLKGVKRTGDGHLAFCPAHDNHNTPALSVSEKDGKLLVHDFGGNCSTEAICAALSIDVKDLFVEPKATTRKAKAEKPLTVADLAAAKQLPEDWLREQGVDDFPDGSGVAIAYFTENGAQHPRMRRRSALRAKDGSTWVGPTGIPVIVYGLWKLSEWR